MRKWLSRRLNAVPGIVSNWCRIASGFGYVDGDRVVAIDGAPWEDHRESGATFALDDVRSLSGLALRQGADVATGAKIFADNCATCHGEDAKGKQELGGPNLTDRIWLYGSDEATMIDVVTNSRGGVMPAWTGRLDPVTIKTLAVYVHTLGGGKSRGGRHPGRH